MTFQKLPVANYKLPIAPRNGFTLIELLLFVAIFFLVITSFVTVLISILKVQVRQSSTTEVVTQSQSLLQNIQYYAERSSLIDIPQDTATTTLKLRMPSAAEDPTYITLSGGTAYLTQASGAAQALTSNKVVVTGLAFTKHSNPPGHDSVTVSYTLVYNGSSSQQNYTESVETAIARVSAATFDSNVVPSSTNTYGLGVSGQVWNNVNGVLYFNGSNVGVGVTSPSQLFQVGGSGGTTGDLYIWGAGNGVIFKSPGGSCFKVTITNAGYVATSSVSCTS